jgi:plastocyanin
MNTNSSVIALVLGAVAVVAAGAACEGRPPLTAAAAMGAAPPVTAEPEESASAEAPETATTCCQCECAGGKTVATAGDGGAPVAVVGDAGADGAAVAVVAPPKPTQGDIVGDVVTTPAYLKAVSVVWLTDAPKVPGRGMRAHMDNRGMAFHPMVQAVTEGGRVSFTDSDPFPHNVFSGDHERFDLGLVQPGHSVTHQFNHAGTYTLLCNLHPNMIGYVVVSPSSYFAKTDAHGHFRIKDVPLGKYSIAAWAPRLQSATQSVSLTGAEAKVSFELHR